VASAVHCFAVSVKAPANTGAEAHLPGAPNKLPSYAAIGGAIAAPRTKGGVGPEVPDEVQLRSPRMHIVPLALRLSTPGWAR